MPLDLGRIDDSALAAAAREYNQKGFLLLTGASDIAGRLAEQIAGRIGADGPTLSSMLDPDKPVVFAPELRQRLSRIDTSRELAVWLVKALARTSRAASRSRCRCGKTCTSSASRRPA